MGYGLSAIVGIQNERDYLAEWIEFHLMQGFEHFTIFDNGSTDNFEEAISPYLSAGIVDVVPVPESYRNRGAGIWMIREGLNRARDRGDKWFWNGSVDEYIIPSKGTVKSFLEHFDLYASLCISWHPFTSNGHKVRTEGLVIERFTEAYTEGTPHVKSLVQPTLVTGFNDPHFFHPKDGEFCVNENLREVKSAHPPEISIRNIRINHYHLMSEAEYWVKMRKGRSDIAGLEGVCRDGALELWEAVENSPTRRLDDRAIQFAAPLKAALQRRFSLGGEQHGTRND